MTGRQAFAVLVAAMIQVLPAYGQAASIEPIGQIDQQSIDQTTEALSGRIAGNIFYVTDRTPDDSVTHPSFGDNQAPHPKLFLGECRATVPCFTLDKSDLSQLQQIDFDLVSSKSPVIDHVRVDVDQRPTCVDATSLRQDEAARRELFEPLHKLVDRSPNKQIAIFVHGFSSTFRYSIGQAARLNRWLKCPVVTYAWATPPVSYFGAQVAADRTQERFQDFLECMEEEFGAQNIVLVAHSMGSGIVDEALKVRYYKGLSLKSPAPKLKEVDMVYADVDAATFVQHADKITPNSEVTRLFVSSDDMVIGVSALVRGSERRLGKPDDLLKTIAKIPDLQIIDVTRLARRPKADSRGMEGHHLCYRLISSLHFNPSSVSQLSQNEYGYFVVPGDDED
jgi:esterase/lipase superfamily enzyme